MNDELNGIRASVPPIAAWRKSSYSNPSGNCVEVAGLGGLVLLRDSRFPGGPALAFTGAAWDGFIGRTKSA